jgi:hypothetical protein
MGSRPLAIRTAMSRALNRKHHFQGELLNSVVMALKFTRQVKRPDRKPYPQILSTDRTNNHGFNIFTLANVVAQRANMHQPIAKPNTLAEDLIMMRPSTSDAAKQATAPTSPNTSSDPSGQTILKLDAKG